MGRRSLSRVVGLVVCALLAVGCGKRYMDLPPMQFYSLLTSNKKVHVIDVRTPQEYADEHIKGALNLPVSDTATFWASVDSLSHKTPFAVYCRSGVRSARAAQMLSERGYMVYNLKGGIEAWKRRRLPLGGTQAPPPSADTTRPRWLQGQLEDVYLEDIDKK